MKFRLVIVLLLSIFTAQQSNADDWLRFRGPGGSGVVKSPLPSKWSPKANIAWKTELPGPGASSPIVVDGKAFVTCYSGYGLTQENPGKIEDLVRHLVCIDLSSGEKLWQKDVKAAQPEDPYSGIGVTAHGYASHTPVSDGKNIYAFFGKSGVHAFDMNGNALWDAKVGMESDPTKWGSSSSPIVYNNIVIVTASAESQAIVGFDKESGKEVWRQEAEGLDGMWGTPTLVTVDDGRTDLVMCVAKELWGLDPQNGKMRWFASATQAQHAYSSIVTNGKRVFAVTGRDGGSVAVDAGGTGDISQSNTVWTGRDMGSFASPVMYDGKIFVFSRGIMTAIDAKSGERIEQLRLKGAMQTGGRFGSLDYASPIVAGGMLYYLNGSGQMFVFDVSGEKAKQVSLNRVTAEKETFWGSPAVSDGKLVLRSQKYLYCVADKGDTVNPEDNMVAKSEEAPPQGRGGFGGGRGGSRGGGGRGGRFNPEEMFGRMDSDKDGKITESELEGNPMASRMMTLDKDNDGGISKEEFANIGSLFRGGRGGRGGGGGGGRPGYGGDDKRPDRPQRPEMAGS